MKKTAITSGSFLVRNVHHKTASACRIGLNGDIYRVKREYISRAVRPFDQAEGARVKVILYADFKCFLQIFQPIEIEMIDELRRGVRTVFVDNGEGRGGDDVGNAEMKVVFPAPISPLKAKTVWSPISPINFSAASGSASRSGISIMCRDI